MRTIDSLFVCESRAWHTMNLGLWSEVKEWPMCWIGCKELQCTCFEVLSFGQKSGNICVYFSFFIRILCEMACFCDFSFVAIL
jgi:hypothetical protein